MLPINNGRQCTALESCGCTALYRKQPQAARCQPPLSQITHPAPVTPGPSPAAQVYRGHMYVGAYREGYETRNPAAMMLIQAAVEQAAPPLPDMEAVLFTWDHSGSGRHAIWAFCEPAHSSPPKFLVPGCWMG